VKVLFFVDKMDSPSSRWRVLQYLPHFRKAGLDCAVEEVPSGMMAKLAAAKHGAGFDVVVLQKRLLPKLIALRLRRNSKKLVFEFDDAITMKKSEEEVRASATRERRFKRVVRDADAVITTNDTLAEEARRVAEDPAKVRVMPTAIDLERWTPRGPAKRDWPYVVGWMGSAAALPHLEIVAPVLVKSCRRHKDLVVRVVCEQAPGLPGVRVEHRPFSSETEVEDLKAFDLAIAPMVEDPWTRGKVSTKVLAYGAAGIPTVASDVSAHRLYLRHGENGYLCGTLTQWEERIEELLSVPGRRDAMGRKARETVEKEYSLAAMVPRYVELFQSLASPAMKKA
jgi:glycosyltransferase involved in cell wall biosynthesis